MKKLFTILGGAVAGVALAAVVSLAGNAIGKNVAYAANPPADACIKVTDGINVNSQNANATVDLDPGCGTHKFVLKSWMAPNALGGSQAPGQVLYAVTQTPVTMSGSTPATKIHVAMFDKTCFYQVDLVDVTAGDAGIKNPIVKAATGGDHDCRPDQTHAYICSALGVTPRENRSATITTFTTSVINARFTGATINWGDGTSSISDTVVGVSHNYAADGTYNISVVADFVYTNRLGNEVRVSAPACTAQVTYTTPPTPETKMINVCEISTKKIHRIDEKLLGSTQYPNDKFTTDLSKCVVKQVTVCVIADKTTKSMSEEEYNANKDKYTTDMTKCVPTVTPPVVTPPTTKPATLVNTGPGTTFALAGTVSVIAAAAHAIWRKRFAA
jgi:hypothetical protein